MGSVLLQLGKPPWDGGDAALVGIEEMHGIGVGVEGVAGTVFADDVADCVDVHAVTLCVGRF